LPDDYGAITFETYHGLGLLTLSLLLAFLIFATIWIVLMFTDTDQPDILDRKTRNRIVMLSLSLCFIAGLAFYTDYYFLLSLISPVAITIYVDYRYRRSYPASLLRVYSNLSIFAGMILGYIVATALVWNDLDVLMGSAYLGMEGFSQALSLFRIGVFIFIYVFMSFIGMLVDGYRKARESPFTEEDRQRAQILNELREKE
jgi:hypothetical protein